MKVVDERSKDQKGWLLIGGTDPFMSGWGEAKDGASYAFWACPPEAEKQVLSWVRKRKGLKRVRIVLGNYRPSPYYCAHCHIYVVSANHPALTEEVE